MIKKQEYFSLRKFKRGLASVTVGATLFMAGALVESFVAPQVVVYAAGGNLFCKWRMDIYRYDSIRQSKCEPTNDSVGLHTTYNC